MRHDFIMVGFEGTTIIVDQTYRGVAYPSSIATKGIDVEGGHLPWNALNSVLNPLLTSSWFNKSFGLGRLDSENLIDWTFEGCS